MLTTPQQGRRRLLKILALTAASWGITRPALAQVSGAHPEVLRIGYQAAGKDLLYVGAEPPKPDSSAVIVLRDSPLKGLPELHGRRVALQKGSSAHYLLFEELTRADRLAQDNRKLAVRLISDFSGLDAGVVSRFLQRRALSPVGPLSAQTLADQQRVADAFYRLGLIPRSPRIADIVWTPERRAA